MDENGYVVERSTNGVTYAEIGRVARGTLAYKDANLPIHRTYYYRARAFNAAGPGTPSKADSVSTYDVTAPTGAITINGGAAYTRSASVSVAARATDDASGVYRVRLSNDGATWDTDGYRTPLAWSLADPAFGGSARQGVRTVSAQWQDSAGNWSEVRTDTIIYDATSPAVKPTS